MKTRETRFTRGLELKEAPKDSGYIGIVEGYAVRYDTDSKEVRLGSRPQPIVERIARGAFKRSLSEKNDIVAVVDHDTGKPFARLGVNLEITEDDAGVFYRAKIPDTTIGRDLLTNVRLGIVNANSFEFEVRRSGGQPVGVRWEREANRDVRIVTDADLFHVSPVIEPAYAATTLSARSADELADLEKESAALLPPPPPTDQDLATRAWEQRVRFL